MNEKSLYLSPSCEVVSLVPEGAISIVSGGDYPAFTNNDGEEQETWQ